MEDKKVDEKKDLDIILDSGEFQENINVILSRKVRIFIFCLFLILSIVVDLDGGIFSSSVDKIKETLEINDQKYGTFVSISFFGRIVGLVIFMTLINFKHRKFTLITTITLHGCSYILYSLSKNFTLLTFIKMFAAANKVCASIYRPVWIEQFGLSNYKSVFFALVQIIGTYGQVIGFNLGSFFFKENWRLALIYIMILMLIIAFCFLLIPTKYFKRSYMFYGNKLVDAVEENNDENSISSDKNSRNSRITQSSTRKKTVFVNLKKKLKKKKYDYKNLLKDLFSLIKNKIYLLSIIKRSMNTFVLEIIHAFLKIYQEKALKNPKEKLIVLFYDIACLVANAVGGLLIGGIITKSLGGYESKKSILVLIIPEILSNVNIFFLIFTNNFYVYNINLIFFFFFYSSSSPIIYGYLIKTIPKAIKATGVGLDMIFSTFLGKIPGPIIYGTLEDKYSEKKPGFAWRITLWYYFISNIFTVLLCYYKYFEEIKGDTCEVNLEDQIVDIAAIGSGSDSNAQFKLTKPVPKRKPSHKKQTDFEIPLINNDDNEDDNN